MNVLVVYATRHGATQGIAERIAATLETDGLDVTLRPVARVDSVEQAWRVVEPILSDCSQVFEYEPGSWGPPEADRLIDGQGDRWHEPLAS